MPTPTLSIAERHNIESGAWFGDIALFDGLPRRRVNQELKGAAREGAVRVEPTRLVVLSRDKLLALSENF